MTDSSGEVPAPTEQRLEGDDWLRHLRQVLAAHELDRTPADEPPPKTDVMSADDAAVEAPVEDAPIDGLEERLGARLDRLEAAVAAVSHRDDGSPPSLQLDGLAERIDAHLQHLERLLAERIDGRLRHVEGSLVEHLDARLQHLGSDPDEPGAPTSRDAAGEQTEVLAVAVAALVEERLDGRLDRLQAGATAVLARLESLTRRLDAMADQLATATSASASEIQIEIKDGIVDVQRVLDLLPGRVTTAVDEGAGVVGRRLASVEAAVAEAAASTAKVDHLRAVIDRLRSLERRLDDMEGTGPLLRQVGQALDGRLRGVQMALDQLTETDRDVLEATAVVAEELAELRHVDQNRLRRMADSLISGARRRAGGEYPGRHVRHDAQELGPG